MDLLDLTGDVTLFVRQGSKPTWSDYNCYDYDYYGLPNRRCAITAPAAGRWWIGVNNERHRSDPVLGAGELGQQHRPGAGERGAAGGLRLLGAGREPAWKYYYVDLAGGDTELVVDLKHLSADADLFVRHGAKPDRSNYDCTSAAVGTGDERCTLPSPAAGRWWIGVNNFSPGTVTYDVQASWTANGVADFYTVTPCRLVDTRQSYPLQAGQRPELPGRRATAASRPRPRRWP